MSPTLKRVLCAENTSDICQVVTTLLEQRGYKVQSASTAAECLELAASEQFDLYLLDDGYPDSSSIYLCRKLRQMNPLVPIMFFTTAAGPSDRQEAIGAGAKAYLVKPQGLYALAETVAELSRGAPR